MGGSAKQVVKKVAKETGYTGSDLDKGAQAVGAKGSEAIEYTKKKGSEVVEGVKEHGGALATGVGQGLGTLGTQAMAGLKHNLDQVASVFMPQSGGGSQKAQGSSANYSQQGKRSRSGAQKKGDLASQERKGATGKQKLYARRKTA